MSFQDTKEEMMRRYRNSKLMQNYYENQQKMSHPFKTMGDAYKRFNGIDKANSLMSNNYQPGAIGNAINSNVNGINTGNSAIGNAITSNASQGTSATSNAINNASAAQGASGALSNASGAMSKVAPVFGAISAGNNFMKGDNVNGALDVAKTGAMFIPGVGWIVSGAIQIGQMVRNALNKKAQQNMQKGQEEAAKAQQEAMNNYANQQAQFDEGTQNGLQNVIEQQQKQQDDTMNQTIAQPQDLKQDIYNQVVTPQEGQVTGGASQTYDFNTPEVLVGHVEQDNPQGYVGTLPDLTQQQGTPEANKRSIMDKLGSFVSDFSTGYDDNVSNGFKQGDLWQQAMANKQSQARPTEEEFATGDAAPVQPQKGVAQRLGEAVGTGQRVMANPWTQAAIAGLITKATGGDWSDAANNAYKYGTTKATSDYYQKQINPNAKPSVLGNFDSKDYNAQTLANYRTTMNDINNAKIKAQLDQNFPLASDYYASQLASGQMSLDDYNKIVSDANYNPNQRISLKTIKTTSDSNYQKDKINVENKKVDNNYQLGKEKNSISKEKNQIGWANVSNSANRNKETARHNGVMEKQGQDKIDTKAKAAQEKAEAKKQAELNAAIQNGDVIMMYDPSGNKVPVGRQNYKEAIKRGYKKA